jgi:hypothetical protein
LNFIFIVEGHSAQYTLYIMRPHQRLINNIIKRRFFVVVVTTNNNIKDLDDRAVSALRRMIEEVKQRWSVIGCFGRYVKPLVPAAFAVVSTHQSALDPHRGYGSFSFCVIRKEGLYLSSGDINRLMMMVNNKDLVIVCLLVFITIP